MKSIQSVLTWLILIFVISGCTTTPVEIYTTEIERVPLNLPKSDVIEREFIPWYVVNEVNAQEKFQEAIDDNYDPGFMCVPDEGYESLGRNDVKARLVIKQQQAIIEAYHEYYEKQNTILDRYEELLREGDGEPKSKGIFSLFRRERAP